MKRPHQEEVLCEWLIALLQPLQARKRNLSDAVYGKHDHALPEPLNVRSSGEVSCRQPAVAHGLTDPPFSYAVVLHQVNDSLPPASVRYHFPRDPSGDIDEHRLTSMLFSLVFSFSSAFNRLASLTFTRLYSALIYRC